MRFLTDRSQKEAVAAITSTWLAFGVAVYLALPQPPQPAQVGIGLLVGAVLVFSGFVAVSRLRPLPRRSHAIRARRGALSLFAGASLGSILVAALVFLARAEPGLRARFTNRLHEPAWRPFALAFEASIVEEVVFRLFVLSVVAWVAGRLVNRQSWAVGAGVFISTVLFALAHLPSWSAATQLSVPLMMGVSALNATAALLPAWVFWRWGLPYAILCHFAGDVVVQSLAPRLLA